MLNVVMLSVVRLNVVMLSLVAPSGDGILKTCYDNFKIILKMVAR